MNKVRRNNGAGPIMATLAVDVDFLATILGFNNQGVNFMQRRKTGAGIVARRIRQACASRRQMSGIGSQPLACQIDNCRDAEVDQTLQFWNAVFLPYFKGILPGEKCVGDFVRIGEGQP